jgi:dienelactone hydrolase
MLRVLALLLLLISAGHARAEEPSPWIRFTSLDGSRTAIDGYLFRPPLPPDPDADLPVAQRRPRPIERHPAVVFLHGCGGLMVHGAIAARERAWAARLNAAGYVVLMVDSFTTRGVRQMCAPSHYQREVFDARPFDAFAALLYLQEQPDVFGDRVGIMGWSEGGGALLATIRQRSAGRPAYLPQGDFRAAVAFYPARCNLRQQGPWVSSIPLLVLTGLEDVWTPAAPCRALIETAPASRSPASIVVYPDAVHDFDWPGMQVVRRPDYTTESGITPIQGENPAAREDALHRVPEFLATHMAP